MRARKQMMFLTFSSVVLVLVCAMAWVSPFLEMPLEAASGNPQGGQVGTTKLTGTIVREGTQFVLHNASGVIYKLVDGNQVAEYESQFVLVTGRLDEKAHILHVEKIKSYSL